MTGAAKIDLRKLTGYPVSFLAALKELGLICKSNQIDLKFTMEGNLQLLPCSQGNLF